jgi:hypothetical protein
MEELQNVTYNPAEREREREKYRWAVELVLLVAC